VQKKTTTPGPSTDGTETPLPAERAFVVQLRAQADPGANLFVGRVEHIASGATQRFDSAEVLIAFMTHVLAPTLPSGDEPSAVTAKRGKTA
jgi:hypothetical protein